MKVKNPPELLSPSGSFEALKSAVLAGADAVYFGSTLFNARMNAKNFTREEIKMAVTYCHESGVKAYVTLNTAILDKNYRDALLLVEFLYKTGVDALIVSDLGLASEIHKYFPDFPIHASTQASGHSTAGAEALSKIGFSRMVIARETSLPDLKSTVENAPIEIEMFVHGALCVSVSGQCLFSSIVGGRSGNRGECAQPCRLPYNSKYPLSLKDLSLGRHITEILSLGVSSLKIEGRMKSPDYVYAVTSVYRRLIDEKRNINDNEEKYLASIFSRDGFTDGYFRGIKDSSMLGVRREGEVSAKPSNANIVNTKSPITLPERSCSLPENYQEILRSERSTYPEGFKPLRSALFYQPESIPDKKYLEYFDIVYLPLDRFDGKTANGVELPPVIYDSEYEAVKLALLKAKEKGARHALISGIGQISLATECGLTPHGSFRLNINSNESARAYSALDDVILSPELLIAQMRDIKAKKNIMVYGRVPLMTLEKPLGTKALTDRRKVTFPVMTVYGRDIVFNSVPTYMADKKELFERVSPYGEFFLFSTEGKREVENTIDSYKKGYTTKREIRRIK